MPSVMSHAVVGLGLAAALMPNQMPWGGWALAAGLAIAPDFDVVGFYLRVPYGAAFGHRGFFHSLFFAATISLTAALACYLGLGASWWAAWAGLFVITASHGLLDACTNGGKGIALLSPFDRTRYFFPWRPIQVAPIGLGFFSRWGLAALRSEILWIWLPTGVLVVAALVFRWSMGAVLN
jgi:inner membrane protein